MNAIFVSKLLVLLCHFLTVQSYRLHNWIGRGKGFYAKAMAFQLNDFNFVAYFVYGAAFFRKPFLNGGEVFFNLLVFGINAVVQHRSIYWYVANLSGRWAHLGLLFLKS